MKNYVIIGGSRGLGDAFAKGLPAKGDLVWIVSRSRPNILEVNDGIQRIWIKADLSKENACIEIDNVIKNEVIDVLLYNAGIWEEEGFEEHYEFEKDSQEQIMKIMTINTTSAIMCIQRLLPNIKKSQKANIIFIGSTAGLPNSLSKQVAYTASKFGINGVAHSLRENLRDDEISVTCVNPGELAATIPYEDGVVDAINRYNGTRIPVQDIVSIVKCITNLSKVACVKEINIPAIHDENV
jgi:short-subunit dehydrogenase